MKQDWKKGPSPFDHVISTCCDGEVTEVRTVPFYELDADGLVLNAKDAERRAAQFIRSYVDPAYSVDPLFEDWEVALY